jgi:DNA helicase II / ATP-dependent DNA helicase PcrA
MAALLKSFVGVSGCAGVIAGAICYFCCSLCDKGEGESETMDYLNQLNDAQREAVVNTEGPSLVIAGAGAGKTRVLTYRIVTLLNRGVPGYRILALTFTNKAAREMKERIMVAVGQDVTRQLWMGTFHSVFSRILRTEGEKLGYKDNFTIYDAADSKQVVRQIIKELSLDDKVYNAGQIASRISAAKNNLITATGYMSNQQFAVRDRSNKMPLLGEIYKRYAMRCFRANAMDFDDLLMNTNILFRDFPEVLRKYQDKFSHLLVDEYQDTNYAQYLIVKQLAVHHNNVCVVGDDAQSIYSFRGARIENIFDFRNDFPGAITYKLEQNYRSTKNIVNAANSIIDKNDGQIRKTIFSNNEEGEKIRVFEAVTDSEEGVRVASDIMTTHHTDHAAWKEFAILYRTNAQSRVFEETLRKKNIPYRVYGGLSFYERKEIKDIMAWFRLIVNPDDEEAFRRAVGFPRRGIGDNTVGKLTEIAGGMNRSLWSVAGDRELHANIFNSGICARIGRFVTLIAEMGQKVTTYRAFDMAKEVALKSGIMQEYRQGKTIEDISRLENIEQLMNGIQEFTEAAETNGEPATLDAYLAVISLISNLDSDDSESDDRVTLMTVHSAKGLEFKYVYVTGLEDNLFPSGMSSGTPRELEEERRLFYVAVTRAMKRATISYALNRYKWGNLERSNPSRFIREIDRQYISMVTGAGKSLTSFSTGNNLHDDDGESGYGAPRATRRSSLRSTEYDRRGGKLYGSEAGGATSAKQSVTAGDIDLEPGDRVRHERFGLGEVISLEGAAPDTTAVVKFIDSGTRKLLLRFAKLTKV